MNRKILATVLCSIGMTFGAAAGFAAGPAPAQGKTWRGRAARVPPTYVHALKFATVSLPGSEDAMHTATRVVITKHAHLMELFEGNTAFARFRVAVGAGGLGQRRRDGDKTTPVGHYHVLRRGGREQRSTLILDFPNDVDRLRFAQMRAHGDVPRGASLSGAIAIHGGTREEWLTPEHVVDWTTGDIAASDFAADQIEAWIPDGTPVDIED